jgi:hypothetical protein
VLILKLFDQALTVAKKSVFYNCLIVIRPRTTHRDLPSRHDLEVYIHNEFVECLEKLKCEIIVSNVTYTFSFGLTFRHRKHLAGSY